MKIVPDKNLVMVDFFGNPKNVQESDLIISVSGYEARAITFIKQFLKLSTGYTPEYLILGFNSYKDLHSRPKNDSWYQQNAFKINEIKISDLDQLSELITSKIKKIKTNKHNKINIHIDYSCMPRKWYCNIPKIILSYYNNINLYFWYTLGIYTDSEYPTAGISDFSRFSGFPSLNPYKRHHIFSLGFDTIRTYAIYRVLDPDSLICVVAKRNKYLSKVYDDNKEIILQANHIIELPLKDIVFSFSRIVEISKSLPEDHDIILVPDGPKPLILIFSLIPDFIMKMGITCLHVARRHVVDIPPPDVKPDLSEGILGMKLINFEMCSHDIK